MKAIRFKGHNVIVAENQEEYFDLPALVMKGTEDFPLDQCITCWELSDDEMMDIAKTRKVYVLTLFGKDVPPMNVSTNPDDFFMLSDDFEQDEFSPVNTNEDEKGNRIT